MAPAPGGKKSLRRSATSANLAEKANEVSCAHASRRHPIAQQLFTTTVLFVLYMVVGVLVYAFGFEEVKLCESDEALEAADDGLGEPCLERWTWVDALYFSMATMSTVGYGDLAPGSSGSRAFTVVFIIVGVAVVFTSIGSLMNIATEPLFDKARTLLDRLFPPRLIDVTANGVYPIRKGAAGKGDFRHPGRAPFYYAKNLLPLALVVVVLQLLCAAVFTALEPGLDYGSAVYFCFVTATTVGYGDVRISTQAARGFACVHVLLSVAMVGALISDIESVRAERLIAFKELRLLRRKLDADLIRSLDKDGDGVDKVEFVVGMLTALELVTWEDAEPFMKQFESLDQNRDGKLTGDDLELLAKVHEERVAAGERRLSEFEVGVRCEHVGRGTGRVTEAYDDGTRVIKFDTGERHRYKPASLHKIKVTVGEDAAAAAAASRRRSWLPSLNPSGLSQSSPV